jgi:hypothetical protein
MKGLAAVLGLKPKGPMGPEEEDGEEAPESESGGSKKGFARLAAEAIADKDFDAAADALVSLVEACKGYGGKE